MASQITIPAAIATHRLGPSRNANTRGSSCILPRPAITQTRLSQYNRRGQSAQINWGCAYSVEASSLLIYNAKTNTDR